MKKIEVHHYIDGAKFSPFHWMILFWCALIIVFDGYDLVVYGVVLPVLMKEWGLTPIQAGALGSYALFGMMFGALIFGPLADRIGRKKAIIACICLFSGFTVLNGFTRTPAEFGTCRFFAGLGIGGVMPNAVALMNEYAPKRWRSTLVAVMFSGYSVGGMMSAGVGIMVIPRLGWQYVFFIAALPLLLLPFMLALLPDSLGFMIRHGHTDQAKRVLAKIAPDLTIDPDDELLLPSVSRTRRAGSVASLFQHGRAIQTIALWIAFFCCLLMVYALTSWLPKLMASAGYGLGSSLMFLLVLNVGAIAGAIGGGVLGDRMHLPTVVVVFFGFAVVSISGLGFDTPVAVLSILVAVAGASTIGTQILLYACVAQFYDMEIRSTGLGWASGVGRNGAIVGPLMGGVLVSLNLPPHLSFIAFAGPGVIAGLAMLVFVLRDHARQTEQERLTPSSAR